MPLLKKKRLYVPIEEKSITERSDLLKYPREESLWKWINLYISSGPVGVILGIFDCLKKVGKGNWVKVSSDLFGEQNFFTERRDLIEESERLENTSINHIDRKFILKTSVNVEKANRQLIPDLLVLLLEENPYLVETSEALEDLDDEDIKSIAKTYSIETKGRNISELVNLIKKHENVTPLVFQKQFIPELDHSWPFYHKGELKVISRKHPSNDWLAKLGTIPQLITNVAFSTWLGGPLLGKDPETWGGGENIIPVLLPFEASKPGQTLDRSYYGGIYIEYLEKVREKLSHYPIDRLRGILSNYGIIKIAFRHKALYETPLDDILEALGELAEYLDEDQAREEYVIQSIEDKESLADYVVSWLEEQANLVNFIIGNGLKFFKRAKDVYEDFGLIVALSKLAYSDEHDADYFNADAIVDNYSRFTDDFKKLLGCVKIKPKPTEKIKSIYPSLQEKKKIKFSL